MYAAFVPVLGDAPALLILPVAIGFIGRQMIRARVTEQDAYYEDYLRAVPPAEAAREEPDFSGVPVLRPGQPPWSAEPPGPFTAVPAMAVSPPQRDERALIGPRICAGRFAADGRLESWVVDLLGAETTAAAVKAIFANV